LSRQQIGAIIAASLLSSQHAKDSLGIHKGLIMARLGLVIATIAFLFGTVGVLSAQQIHLPPTVSQGQGMGDVPVTDGTDIQRQQALAANEQRQLEIRRDTEKMAELTQELKDYVLKSEKGVVSLDALKKAEQIEKLAKSVKSKMKQSF
jgi:hypothetical protein